MYPKCMRICMKEAESTRGKVKRMLLEWGASLDQCGRKQEEDPEDSAAESRM